MPTDLSALLNKPLPVGEKQVENRLLLAPLTGLGHIAFRELLSEFGGCGLLFTEMCSARALPHENRHLSPVFRWRNEELPRLVCQLLGSDSEAMARAAERVEKEGFFGVDINMGCSVAAICKQNCGAALLKTPDLAADIVRSVRRAVSIPVTVKFRTGWEDNPAYAAELAKRFEDAGADALTFHPRVAPDRRSRPPRWEHIRRVKKSVSIPVFGNGNVFGREDCLKMLSETGCDGVALGRIAIARPWVFRSWTKNVEPDADVFRYTALRLAELLEKHHEPPRAIRLFKRFAVYFSANFRFGHAIYHRLCRAEDMSAIRENIDREFCDPPQTTPRPNLNLFAG